MQGHVIVVDVFEGICHQCFLPERGKGVVSRLTDKSNRHRDRYRDRTPCEAIARTATQDRSVRTIPIPIAIWSGGREDFRHGLAEERASDTRAGSRDRPLDKPEEMGETISQQRRHTEPSFARGSRIRWSLTLGESIKTKSGSLGGALGLNRNLDRNRNPLATGD